MKICLIGPGYMPIPPIGWGAVESLIWDYSVELESLGHDVSIVNTTSRELMINQVNDYNPDVVHLQYDEYIDVLDSINPCIKIATSHFGYIEQPRRWESYYGSIARRFIESGAYIFALSPGIKEIYLSMGADESKVFVTPNGARSDLFRFDPICAFPNNSIYLAKIEPRKRQTIVQGYNAGIFFAGNCVDNSFNQADHYLGHWTKQHLYQNLTAYANLVLLSDGEAHPLVTCEALMSGLGLVVSERAAANLDRTLDFIDVIPNSLLDNRDYIYDVIINNRAASIANRSAIREYALSNFDWSVIAKRYEGLLNTLRGVE